MPGYYLIIKPLLIIPLIIPIIQKLTRKNKVERSQRTIDSIILLKIYLKKSKFYTHILRSIFEDFRFD